MPKKVPGGPPPAQPKGKPATRAVEAPPPPATGLELDDKEERFVQAYLENNCNGTRAMLAIGFKGTRASACVMASRMLGNVKVRARLREVLDRHAAGREEVVFRLSEHSRADLTECLSETGELDILRMRDAGLLHLVKSVEEEVYIERTGSDESGKPVFERVKKRKVTLHDAQAATVHLGKMHGIFKADELNLAGGLAEALAKAWGEAAAGGKA